MSNKAMTPEDQEELKKLKGQLKEIYRTSATWPKD